MLSPSSVEQHNTLAQSDYLKKLDRDPLGKATCQIW